MRGFLQPFLEWPSLNESSVVPGMSNEREREAISPTRSLCSPLPCGKKLSGT